MEPSDENGIDIYTKIKSQLSIELNACKNANQKDVDECNKTLNILSKLKVSPTEEPYLYLYKINLVSAYLSKFDNLNNKHFNYFDTYYILEDITVMSEEISILRIKHLKQCEFDIEKSKRKICEILENNIFS